MPISFIAGFYGMNFRYMPGLDNDYGYLIILAVMITIASSFLFFFRRKGWV